VALQFFVCSRFLEIDTWKHRCMCYIPDSLRSKAADIKALEVV